MVGIESGTISRSGFLFFYSQAALHITTKMVWSSWALPFGPGQSLLLPHSVCSIWCFNSWSSEGEEQGEKEKEEEDDEDGIGRSQMTRPRVVERPPTRAQLKHHSTEGIHRPTDRPIDRPTDQRTKRALFLSFSFSLSLLSVPLSLSPDIHTFFGCSLANFGPLIFLGPVDEMKEKKEGKIS